MCALLNVSLKILILAEDSSDNDVICPCIGAHPGTEYSVEVLNDLNVKYSNYLFLSISIQMYLEALTFHIDIT